MPFEKFKQIQNTNEDKMEMMLIKQVFAALSLEIEVYVAIFNEGYATADKLVSHKAVVGCDIR